MNLFHLNLLLSIILLKSESASIPKTLELFKKDVSEVGGAVETFTFDILREMLDDSEENETTTGANLRKKRSAEDEVKHLCQKRCEEAQKIETQQIRDLKSEVQKLQEMVRLLQNQQKIIDILDTKETRSKTDEDDASNTEQLAKMKTDLENVIQNLNQTRELIELQTKKDEVLEEELLKQKQEMGELKSTVAAILQANSTDGYHPSARASEFSTIRKLLKSLPDDDGVEDDDISSKLLQLQKQLAKKRRQEALMHELKQLEKSVNQDDSTDSELLKQIIKAIKTSEPQSKSDDLDVTNLADLEDAINKLRPKENQANQFQQMLNQLLVKQTNQRPAPITITAQQMNELTKKLAPNNHNSPYICVVDDGRGKSGGYRAPANPHQFYSPPDYSNQRGQQFFPGQSAQPNYYAQGIANGPSVDKPGYYQGQNGDPNPKYQEDLRQQIDGLQAAIDNMNRPEYLQKPEDKAIVEDLEHQIGDLRNIVNNLNYDGARYKRSLENNEVEGSSDEVVAKMSEFVDNLMKEKPKTEVADIQHKIDAIKSQLDSGSNKARSATTSFYPPPLPQLYSDDLFDSSGKELKNSIQNDFFAQVVGKILDKIISVIPVIIQKIFSFSLQELGKYDSQDYDVQVLFKNLGIFAYLPVILLRIVKGIGAFMNMLRKNSFFKTFLMPALILGTIAGSVIFLIWWLQPDDVNSSYNYLTYDQTNPQYSSPTPSPQYPVSYNNPVYNRSYFNK